MRNTYMFAKLCVPLFLVACHTSSSSVARGSGSGDTAHPVQASAGSATQPQQIEAQPQPAPVVRDPDTQPAPAPQSPPVTPAAPATQVTPPVTQAPPTRPAQRPRKRPIEEPPASELPASGDGGPPGMGQDCGPNDSCARGLVCVSYYGIAGARGPEFKSCEIRCGNDPGACPAGTSCVTVSDGPGRVCR